MATLNRARQQLHRVAAKWPRDPFRPNLQLRVFLESLANHPNLTLQAATAASALQEGQFHRKVGYILSWAFNPYVHVQLD